MTEILALHGTGERSFTFLGVILVFRTFKFIIFNDLDFFEGFVTALGLDFEVGRTIAYGPAVRVIWRVTPDHLIRPLAYGHILHKLN